MLSEVFESNFILVLVFVPPATNIINHFDFTYVHTSHTHRVTIEHINFREGVNFMTTGVTARIMKIRISMKMTCYMLISVSVKIYCL